MSNFPKVSRNIPVPSGQNWSLSNVPGSGTQYCLFKDDGIYATPTLTANNPFVSSYLQANKFDCGIPTGSGYTLGGIEVFINRYSDGGMFSASSVSDLVVSLTDSGGNIVGVNKALSGLWPLALTNQVYGTATDTWNTGWNSLLDGGIGMVNSSGFGVILQVNEAAGGAGQDQGKVDSISVVIHLLSSGTKINSVAFPLFIHGYTPISGNIPLFIDGGGNQSGNIPLYTKGLASGNASIPLYMDVATPFSGSFPLFMDGGPHVSNCYTFAPTSVRTICGSQDTSWVNPNNILLNDNTRATCTMTSGDARSCQLLTYFNVSGIHPQAQVSGIIFTFINNKT